ncbi:MAG: diguanylate cyclase [Bacteriovoracaceae bacterium]|nr:diguanylate cyclase [Bacteriovoracaceae bacterium]
MGQIIQIKADLPKPLFYRELEKQLRVVLGDESNRISRMATVASVLGETKKFLWAGFYLVEGDELVLGPFSGPLACFRIKKGRGVCGTAWATEKAILVPNVHDFPGHIACSSLSNSEIVIPIRDRNKKKIIGVLDIDHVDVNGLDEDDLQGFKNIADLIG